MKLLGKRRVSNTEALERQLRQDIYSAVLKDGDMLASENQLIKKYNLSGYYVRKAISNLKKEGLLQTIRGSGTFVVAPGNIKKTKKQQIKKEGKILFLSFESYFSKHLLNSPGTYDPIYRGLSKVFSDSSYDLLFGHISDNVTMPEHLLYKDIAGVIFLGDPPHEFFHKYLRKYPCVGINNYQFSPKFDRIRLDDEARSYIAVEHLVSLGHRRIAYFSDHINTPLAELRIKGFRKGIQMMGLEVDPQLEILFSRIPEGESDVPWSAFPDYTAQLEPLFKLKEPPTAIICYDDPRLVAVQFTLLKMGLNVPDDISLVGAFNERQIWCENSTSVYDRVDDLCAEAAHLLFSNINTQKPASGKTILLLPKLIVGKTTKKLHS